VSHLLGCPRDRSKYVSDSRIRRRCIICGTVFGDKQFTRKLKYTYIEVELGIILRMLNEFNGNNK
jgi:hypothetical protein